ncbi:MAG: ribonuclease III [Chloroflexota bacterium]|nr:MAG: ribonuclease III [Chloroflexota bacterium]
MEDTQGRQSPAARQKWAERLGIPFNNLSLLTRAFTHRSYINEHHEAIEDNERLEFLGDAVLDFIVGAWLYNRFPEMAEGEMTRMRSALVRTEQLAEFANKIDLGDFILLGHGEDVHGGRERLALLCAGFEALIGALYLEQDIPAVSEFMRPLLNDATEKILARGRTRDPKSLFQEWIQSQGMSTPVYRTVSESGPDHAKSFSVEVLVDGVVYGHGEGHNKREAAKMAAQKALERLNV